MGAMVTLAASDGHNLSAYRAGPKDKPKAAVVIVQEIFGLTDHIKDVCERFAAAGYAAIAPALFDRVRPGIVIGYTNVDEARAVRAKLTVDQMMMDLGAAVQEAANTGPVGMVGYCFGGTLAWVAASRIEGLKAAVGFYAGGIVQYLHDAPKCSALLHFAEKDTMIPLTDVEQFRKTYPSLPIHVYEGAEHGFNCNDRVHYHAAAAKLSHERTLAFLAEHVG